jgi:DNA-binding PadR family transcriptional regulator
MHDLSDGDEAVLRFLRDQPNQQASHDQVVHDNRYLRAQMRRNPGAIRGVLDGLADRSYVERLLGGFSGTRGAYGYRLTEQGDQELTDAE